MLGVIFRCREMCGPTPNPGPFCESRGAWGSRNLILLASCTDGTSSRDPFARHAKRTLQATLADSLTLSVKIQGEEAVNRIGAGCDQIWECSEKSERLRRPSLVCSFCRVECGFDQHPAALDSCGGGFEIGVDSQGLYLSRHVDGTKFGRNRLRLWCPRPAATHLARARDISFENLSCLAICAG